MIIPAAKMKDIASSPHRDSRVRRLHGISGVCFPQVPTDVRSRLGDCYSGPCAHIRYVPQNIRRVGCVCWYYLLFVLFMLFIMIMIMIMMVSVSQWAACRACHVIASIGRDSMHAMRYDTGQNDITSHHITSHHITSQHSTAHHMTRHDMTWHDMTWNLISCLPILTLLFSSQVTYLHSSAKIDD